MCRYISTASFSLCKQCIYYFVLFSKRMCDLFIWTYFCNKSGKNDDVKASWWPLFFHSINEECDCRFQDLRSIAKPRLLSWVWRWTFCCAWTETSECENGTGLVSLLTQMSVYAKIRVRKSSWLLICRSICERWSFGRTTSQSSRRTQSLRHVSKFSFTLKCILYSDHTRISR